MAYISQKRKLCKLTLWHCCASTRFINSAVCWLLLLVPSNLSRPEYAADKVASWQDKLVLLAVDVLIVFLYKVLDAWGFLLCCVIKF